MKAKSKENFDLDLDAQFAAAKAWGRPHVATARALVEGWVDDDGVYTLKLLVERSLASLVKTKSITAAESKRGYFKKELSEKLSHVLRKRVYNKDETKRFPIMVALDYDAKTFHPDKASRYQKLTAAPVAAREALVTRLKGDSKIGIQFIANLEVYLGGLKSEPRRQRRQAGEAAHAPMHY